MDTLWPLLKEHRFENFLETIAWRHTEKRTDVVQTRFFSSAKTRQWNIPNHSFSISIGCFLNFIPSLYTPKLKVDTQGRALPSDATECHLRLDPVKRLKQRGCKYANIWCVSPSGENLKEVVDDVILVVTQTVFPWLDKWNSLKQISHVLEHEDEGSPSSGETWGLGNKNSPVRHILAGFVALELGAYPQAKKHLEEVQRSGSFAALSGDLDIDDKILAALEIARSRT